MQKHKKKEYQTPMVELMEARVERGFAGSGTEPQPQGTNGTTEGLTGSSNSYTGSDFD